MEAGVDSENAALVAATNSDELNLLCAAVGKGVGAGKAIARVHHSAYFDQRGLDYAKQFDIDRLICPEYSTALAIASTLRNPAALAIENFASGQIEVQEFPVPAEADVVGKTLIEISLPPGVRLAAIRRGATVSLPMATSTIEAGDVVILVGNTEVFGDGRKLFQEKKPGRRRELDCRPIRLTAPLQRRRSRSPARPASSVCASACTFAAKVFPSAR